MSKFTKKELENSKRIFKSATPKYTIDWYLKNAKWLEDVTTGEYKNYYSNQYLNR